MRKLPNRFSDNKFVFAPNFPFFPFFRLGIVKVVLPFPLFSALFHVTAQNARRVLPGFKLSLGLTVCQPVAASAIRNWTKYDMARREIGWGGLEHDCRAERVGGKGVCGCRLCDADQCRLARYGVGIARYEFPAWAGERAGWSLFALPTAVTGIALATPVCA